MIVTGGGGGGVDLYSRLGRLYICIFRPSAQTGSLPFTCMFSSLVSCLVRLYGHSEYQPMRASFPVSVMNITI